MYPNESCSEDHSTSDAFPQKEESQTKQNYVPEWVDGSSSGGAEDSFSQEAVRSNEVTSSDTKQAARATTDLTPTFPINQVPVSRDTTDSIKHIPDVGSQAADSERLHAQSSVSIIPYSKEQMRQPPVQQQYHSMAATSSWSGSRQSDHPRQCLARDNSQEFSVLVKGSWWGFTCPISETQERVSKCHQSSPRGARGGKGADPPPCLTYEGRLVSVISSSTSTVGLTPPSSSRSGCSHCAEQGSNATFASQCGSSSSNSLFTAQSQAEKGPAITQAIVYPNTSQVQNKGTFMQSSVNASVLSREGNQSPNLNHGPQTTTQPQGEGDALIGALSNQDNSKNMGEENLPPSPLFSDMREGEGLDANTQNSSANSVKCICNIPGNSDATSDSCGSSSALSKAICTVQGNKSNPSFSMESSSGEVKTSATVTIFMSNASVLSWAAGKPSLSKFASYHCGPASSRGWGIPRGLGLFGGASGSSGNSGWGTPPSSSSNNSGWGQAADQGNTTAQGQWGNNANRSGPGGASQGVGQQNPGNKVNPPPSQPPPQQPASQPSSQQQPVPQQGTSTSWAQAAGKGLPTSQTNSSASSSNPSKQVEQLNSIREALFSQGGWGGEHVNQDSSWDVPSSPEPGPKDGSGVNGPNVWKANVNNGTELWENNLRNGGQPPPQPQKAQWHTPSTNIGGTWGEDDEDVGDSSNVWTGVPNNIGTNQWGTSNSSSSSSLGNNNMWGGTKKEGEWSGHSGHGGPSVHGTPNVHGAPNVHGPPNVHGASNVHGGPGVHGGPNMPAGQIVHGAQTVIGGPGVHNAQSGQGVHSGHSNIGAGGTSWGDPRSNPVNGDTVSAAWGQPPQKPASNHGQWSGPVQKEIKPTGWEEPSPPTHRRNIPNMPSLDINGTALWGNPGQQPAGKVSHWKEMPTPNVSHNGRHGQTQVMQGVQVPPGPPQNRMLPNVHGTKPDGGPIWGHPQARNDWVDPPHDTGNTRFGDDPKTVTYANSWAEPPLSTPSWTSKPKTPTNPGGLGDSDMVDTTLWMQPKQGPKSWTKDIIWASKQFRILTDMGFKKDDVENALRNSNMVLEDALETLSSIHSINRINMDWRQRQDDHVPFDHSSNIPGQRFNPSAQQMPFPLQGPGAGSAPSLLSNVNNASINNLSPAIVQKLLQQQQQQQQLPQQQQQAPQQPAPFLPAPRGPQSQPSASQLRLLVQQIQMAVQAGHLNPQILNQPLAPQTLILLNQLLQQIKVLQQLTQNQSVVQAQQHIGKSNNSSPLLHISVQITKTKQQITNLQNQITAQQAQYLKQQQQPPLVSHAPQPTPDIFKHPMADPMVGLPSNFDTLSMKDPQISQQGSRLQQWKLPSLNKEDSSPVANDFSRAPGSASKPALAQSQSSPNLNPLASQSDTTWSTPLSRSQSETGWPEPTSSGNVSHAESKESQWPISSQSPSVSSHSNYSTIADLVPEFEPGKPWKGTQMKNIEDDPTATPGSVAPSPLLLLKDSETFSGGNKTSPTVSSTDTPLTPFSSSTWSFSGVVSTSSASTVSRQVSKVGTAKEPWGDAPPPTNLTSELWGAPTVGKSRGPPPGLATSRANGWGAIVGGMRTSWGTGGSVHVGWSEHSSNWLLLRNLTPQIDGSTLKTLCLQHGPLQFFYLYLNHGIALVKYSCHEEAAKAQGALNNCVLGNTTILASSPQDSDVQSVLQQLGHASQQQQQQQQQQQHQHHQGAAGWAVRGSTPTTTPGPGGLGPGQVPLSSAASGPITSKSVDGWALHAGGLWPVASVAGSHSVWGAPCVDDPHRGATPSSLNSYLPGDLLGDQAM